MGSFVRTEAAAGLLGFAWYLSRAPNGRGFSSDLHGFIRALLKVAGFIRMIVSGRRVYTGSRTFTRFWLLGLFQFACVHSAARSGGLVHLDSRGFTCGGLGVVGFIRIRMRSIGRAKGSSGSFLFAWVHSDARLGFIRVRVGSVWRSSGSSGSCGFAWFHSGAH